MLPPTAVELTSVPGCMTSKSSPSMVTSIHSRSPSGSSSASSALRFEALNGDATRTRSPGSARVSAHASWHRIVRSLFFQPSARSPSIVVAAGSQSSAPAFASPHGRTRRSSRPSTRDTETTRNAPSAAPSASTRHSRASRSRRAASEKKEGSRWRKSPRRTEAASFGAAFGAATSTFGAAFGAATSTFGAAVSLPVTLVAAVWRPPRASTATPPPRSMRRRRRRRRGSKSASRSSPQSHSNGFFGSGRAEVRRAGAVGGCRGTVGGCCAATTSVLSTRVGPGSNRSDGSGSDSSVAGSAAEPPRLASPSPAFSLRGAEGTHPYGQPARGPGRPRGSAHIAWTSARSAPRRRSGGTPLVVPGAFASPTAIRGVGVGVRRRAPARPTCRAARNAAPGVLARLGLLHRRRAAPSDAQELVHHRAAGAAGARAGGGPGRSEPRRRDGLPRHHRPRLARLVVHLAEGEPVRRVLHDQIVVQTGHASAFPAHVRARGVLLLHLRRARRVRDEPASIARSRALTHPARGPSRGAAAPAAGGGGHGGQRGDPTAVPRRESLDLLPERARRALASDLGRGA